MSDSVVSWARCIAAPFLLSCSLLAGCGGGGGGEDDGLSNQTQETGEPQLDIDKPTSPEPPPSGPVAPPEQPDPDDDVVFTPPANPSPNDDEPPSDPEEPPSDPEDPPSDAGPEQPPGGDDNDVDPPQDDDVVTNPPPVGPPPEPPVIDFPENITFDGLVYTRQPRARLPVPGTALEDASNWQHVSDVGRINGGLAEADVVIDDLRGNVRVIHNCTTSEEICVAQEARVSPDGTKIAYSVGYGNSLEEVRVNGVALGIYDIPALTHARLFIYDIATGVSTPVPNHSGNIIDRQPEWLDNDTLVFTSNRAGVYPHKTQFGQHRGLHDNGDPRWGGAAAYGVFQPYGYRNAGKAMQIWTMDIDGGNARNLSPHETMALSPTVLTNGDILYSCWNGHANEAFDEAYRHSNKPGTEVNKWWICRVDGNGARGDVVLNAHHSPHLKTRDFVSPTITGGEGAAELRAVRSAAEIRRGYVAVTNYYRSNHTGSLGIVYGWTLQEPGVEGVSRLDNLVHRTSSNEREGSGRYLPSDFMALTPYGNDQDLEPRRHANGGVVGKAGYASPLPGGDDYLITHARGICYEATPTEWANSAWTGGEPLCQKGVYRVKVDQVTDPFDPAQMELLAGGDQWHVFDADAITDYRSLWGHDLPQKPAPLSGDRCFLQVVDGRAAELQAPEAYNWTQNLYQQCSQQGCAVNTEDKSFHADNMEYLTVYEVDMWDLSYADGGEYVFANTTNNHGFKALRVWGYQPLEEDGSIRMEVPCETPIQIVGQDADKMTIAHDDKLHSLRRGETRTCHGCHDGHSEERAAQLGEPAVERFARTLAAQTSRPAPDNGYRRTWSDIEPLLVDNCSECHEDMNNDDGLLQSRIAWDFDQIDWPWMERQPTLDDSFRLPRPYTSKWVAKLARNSLLYWKCMGERTDGRTDRQYPDDIDFGAAHPAADPMVCQQIGQWIDQGIQRDPD